jgi:hypothetical protein
MIAFCNGHPRTLENLWVELQFLGDDVSLSSLLAVSNRIFPPLVQLGHIKMALRGLPVERNSPCTDVSPDGGIIPTFQTEIARGVFINSLSGDPGENPVPLLSPLALFKWASISTNRTEPLAKVIQKIKSW